MAPDGDTIITSWTEHACVRDCEWAYIVNTGRPGARAELFHTASDPYESTDVAAAHPEIVRNRQHMLEAFLGGPLPFTYPTSRTRATR